MKGSIFLLMIWLVSSALAWDADELEVFDVVEEVGISKNFYELLSVPRDADSSAIKKAFRKLSLVLHPDKNDAPDAEVQFRQLVAVHDILKDKNKRKYYDNVLENGLPDWKQAIYYYRRVRKMGLLEMSVILFVIFSIGQYLYGWANYFEKKLTVEDYVNSKSKKLKKLKRVKGEAATSSLLEELDSVLVKPSVKDTLPFQIPRWLWFLFVSGPPLLYHSVCDWWRERQLRKLEELQQPEESEEEVEVVRERAPRKRKTFVLPELSEEQTNGTVPNAVPKRPSAPPVIVGGLWTDDDLLELARLVNKHPAGSTERWEKIGEAMNRTPHEVAHMAHKLDDETLKKLAQKATGEDSGGEEEPPEEPKKVKTKGGKVKEQETGSTWSQVQQKALEAALAKFPKGAASDRWEKIAKCVPGKTKEECMLRYKHLVDVVKKKKEQEDTEQSENPQDENATEKGIEDSTQVNGYSIT
ncbi:uncharacterized protein F54F2.9-like [Macrosteles quadrilineatus]|uniref:uncharacterized protein F54F2.9-like n=1 Tax=Macrosteles quadrilineatus TaxID=74068 RepID=UPI0023E20084|nr:uncharacterized protein F54F2.9-like [Macrosteles quadrilineatus]XP_054262300.1 uncharacterized protein F54F2.9-like [Macrosteles quadrilineatus]